MPITPRPMTFECPQCHWKRTYAPSTDTLLLPSWAQCCPRCGHKGMQYHSANRIAELVAKLWPRQH
jgi:Zn finger protein HypA/HybF involved in hydrogenase expression